MAYKTILLIFLLVVLSACGTTAQYEEVLDSWVGSNANELVQAWGYPENSFSTPNGNTVYVYRDSSGFTMPTETNSTFSSLGNTVHGRSTTTGGQRVNLTCTTYFDINKSNIIVKWGWEGNNCKSR